jgi:hypothetical protein
MPFPCEPKVHENEEKKLWMRMREEKGVGKEKDGEGLTMVEAERAKS